jgi:D-alanine-D-alanine ligase
VPALCDFYNIPYIGSTGYVMTMARNKYHTNRFLMGIGIKVPPAFLIPYGDQLPEGLPEYPVIIKPNDEAGALGICEQSIVTGLPAIKVRAEALHEKFKHPVIIEEYIIGEEFKVAVIGNGGSAKAVGCVGVSRNGKPIVGSLQTREDIIYDRLSYYTPNSKPLIEKAMEVAVFIHRQMGCRDYSRIDFRISKDGSSLVFMEVSTQPDIGKHSSFISAAKQSFSTYENVIKGIYNSALQRYNFNNKY